MRRYLRLAALMLAALMLLQCAAVAMEPEDLLTTQAAAGNALEITASLQDGEVVHSAAQSLRVSASGADAITVTCGGTPVEAQDGAYPLKLSQGDNEIVITAFSASEESTLTLTVRLSLTVPEGWAHDALVFCVEHGILSGDQNGNLLATSSATRAQMAAMIVRLFHAQPMADLSGYTDVPSGAWYRAELSRAVAMGIFEGSNGKLTPERAITREQAFTVLSRAFGVAAEDLDILEKFPDADIVSPWAQNGIAGMLELGYIHGNTKGLLNPKGYITRQELAQVLYNALDCITDDPDALTGVRNLYTGPLDALTGRTVHGDLILSASCPEEVTLEDFSVDGRLVLQLHGAKRVTLGEISDTVSVCCPVVATLTKPVARVLCLRDGAYVIAVAEDAVLLGDGALRGEYDSVFCLGGDPTIAADTVVKALYAGRNMADGTIYLYGAADALFAEARRLTVTENGRIDTVYQYHNEIELDCEVGAVVDRIDVGLEGVSIVPGPVASAYYERPTVTVSGTVTGVDTEQMSGVTGDARICTAIYRYEGEIIKVDPDFHLRDGEELSCELTPELQDHIVDYEPVRVTLFYHGETLIGSLPLCASGYESAYAMALEEVRTIRVTATVKYTTSIYANSALSGYIGTVSAGSEVYFTKYGTVGALIETQDGKRGWVSSSAIRISWYDYHNDEVSYTDEVKEAFVNQVHSYSSSTGYLVWCNLYTTTVNIFEGSKGNWKLIKSCECVIGAPDSPTRPGVYSIYSHAYYWSFDNGLSLDDNRCYYASLFDGGIAFHTRLYYTDTNTMVNPALSAEISHGCVRCPDDIAKFIYYQCPIGTTVVVY